MNYDLITWIEYFIGAFICCFGGFLCGKILLGKKFNEIKFYKYFLLFPLAIFTVLNSLAFDNIIKIFGTLIVYFMIFKFMFDEKSTKICIYSIVVYIILMVSDIIFALIVSLLDFIFKLTIANNITNTIFSNIMVVILTCCLTLILRKKILNYFQKIKKSRIWIISLQGLITIFIIISSLNHLYLKEWKFSYDFILNTIIIFGSAFLTFILLKQYLKNKEVVDKFQLLEDYMKTSTVLIEQYSTTNHKYKNNLIAIKGYIKSNPKEALEFVSDLLENYKDEKFKWFSSINYISFDSIRYLICYKLSTAEEKKIKILVNVDKNLTSINTKLMNIHQISIILDILGEFFDNSIYASYESNEKEIVFNAYLENEKIVFEISNTYLGKIDLDMITKNGYTTKGKGHGFGLYEIDKNIENYSFLDYKYEIIDNYFIAKLYIALDDLEKED